MKQLAILLKISRPIFWLGPACIYLAAIMTRGVFTSWLAWWGLLFMTFPMGIIVYGINDLADAKSDELNARKGGIEGHILKAKEHALLKKVVYSSMVIFLVPYLVLGQFVAASFLVLIYIFAYIYSVNPIRLKTRPFLDSLSNGWWVLLVALTGYTINATTWNVVVPPAVLLLCLAVCAVHAIGAVLDYETDRKVGDQTIAVFLGQRPTLALCFLIFSVVLGFMKPVVLAVQLFILLIIFLSLLMFIKVQSQKVIHHSAWIIVLGFVGLMAYLLIFETGYLVQIMR